MNDPKNFRKLDLKQFERLAQGWMERFPFLQKILLCSTKPDELEASKEPFRRALVFIVPVDFEKKLDEAILPRGFLEKLRDQIALESDYVEFGNWLDGLPLNIQNALESLYRPGESPDIYEWLFFREDAENWRSNEMISSRNPWTYPEQEESEQASIGGTEHIELEPQPSTGQITEPEPKHDGHLIFREEEKRQWLLRAGEEVTKLWTHTRKWGGTETKNWVIKMCNAGTIFKIIEKSHLDKADEADLWNVTGAKNAKRNFMRKWLSYLWNEEFSKKLAGSELLDQYKNLKNQQTVIGQNPS